MRKTTQARIATHFAALTDPRRGKVTYPLINVVTIALCGMLCGADDFVSIAEWGRQGATGWPSSSISRPAFPRTIASTPSSPL